MSYAVLMAYVEADRVPENRVRLAASLADKFGATLIGMSALALHPPFLVESVVIQQATAADVEETMAALSAKEDWFRNLAAAGQRKIEWRSMLDFPADALMSEARSADLVIIGQSSEGEDAFSALDPGAALLKIGRPALIVPDQVSSLRAEQVVIGWKESREARRAVLDALPFLHEAAAVTVAEICEPDGREAAEAHLADVIRYLMRHRIKAEARVLLQKEGTGSAKLVELAQENGADLLVTGAYGHTRLSERIFGGMTQELLATSPICCLMSH